MSVLVFPFQSITKKIDKEILPIKEFIVTNSKMNGIITSILYNNTIIDQSNVCNSTLVYPEYAHSTQCYPHL